MAGVDKKQHSAGELVGEMTAIMHVVARRTDMFLRSQIGLTVNGCSHHADGVQCLELKDLTSLVSVGGSLNMIIAFSFDAGLIAHISQKFTDGIAVGDDERELYLNDAASEMINTIIGNCTAELAERNAVISMSPPVIITGARSVHRAQDAKFFSVTMSLSKGSMGIYFIGPRGLFDDNLETIFASNGAQA
jgi:CheY-specific phosphatase CheX